MTIDSKYSVPTVAVHTHVFERAVRSVTRVNGMPRARTVFVPQPGPTSEQAAAAAAALAADAAGASRTPEPSERVPD